MKTPRTPIATCPDVGKVIRTHIKKRRISKAALSRNVNHSHHALYSILQRPSLARGARTTAGGKLTPYHPSRNTKRGDGQEVNLYLW